MLGFFLMLGEAESALSQSTNLAASEGLLI